MRQKLLLMKTHIFLPREDEFSTTNDRINGLNNDISDLKEQLQILPEKDNEIYQLQCKIDQLIKEKKDYRDLAKTIEILKADNKKVHDECDKLKINLQLVLVGTPKHLTQYMQQMLDLVKFVP